MANSQRDVVVRFLAQTNQLEKGSDIARGKLAAVATSLKGVATLGATVAGANFLKGAIESAGDLNETTSKVGVVFGSAAGTIQKFAADADSSLGQSQQSAMDAAATFATFGKGAGLTGQELAKFSTSMVTLSSDMASFSNTTPEEAIEALGAALRGENDPIEKYGVLLNEATIQQAGLRLGLIKTTSEALTPQQRVLAAQAEIFRQTSDAHGDFARTSDGAANSQRILAAQFANAQAELGQKFLPVVNKVTQVLSQGVLPAATEVAGTIADVVVPAVEGLFNAGTAVVGMWQGLPAPIQNAAIAMGVWALAGDRVEGFFTRTSGPMKTFGEDVKTAMGAFEVNAITGSFMALEERIPAVAQMGQSFRKAKGDADGFKGAVKGVAAGGLSALKSAGSGLVGLLGGPWGIAITGATALLTLFATQTDRSAERQRELADAGKEVAHAIAEQKGALNAVARESAAKLADDKGLLRQAEDLNIALPRVTNAIVGQKGAYEGLNKELDVRLKRIGDEQSALGGMASNENRDRIEHLAMEAGRLQQLKNDLQSVIGGRDSEAAALRRQAAAQREEVAAKDGVASSTSRAKHTEETWRAVLEASGVEYDKNKTKLDNLITAIEKYNNQAIMATDSEEAWYAALDALDTAIGENGKTLDIRTQKGRDNRDAIQEAASASKDFALKQIQEGVSVTDALKAHDNRIARLKRETAETFGAKSSASQLIDTYGAIPKNVVTEFHTKGYDATWAKLNSLSAGQILGQKGMPITPANVRAIQKDLKMGRYATGGAVFGEGTSTSDDILARLSNNEHVWTAAEVRAAGGHGAVQALRDLALRGQLPAYAKGGAVTWKQQVDVSKFKIPDPMAYAIAAAGNVAGGSGVQRWAPLVLQVLRMLGQSAALLPNVLRRMNQESGGNPRAINLWDSNARRGTPSIGLMQTIGPTFAAYAGPFRGRGIYDPLANIYAGLNYAINRYGSLKYAMDKPGGYDSGGWLKPGQTGVNGLRKPEAVLTPEESAAYKALAKSAAAGQMGTTIVKNYNLTTQVKNYEVDVATQFAIFEMLGG